MNISLITIGRIGFCPEANLVKKYKDRFDKLSNLTGIKPIKIIEIDEKKYRTLSAQAKKVREKFEIGSSIFLLHERGKIVSSKEFTKFLSIQRDTGVKNQVFVIGGAFGFCSSLEKDADGLLSLGKMVWPHFLTRVLVLEQIYRAASIMIGSPYHKN
jgi:23S rRNA (pseudouridine1915-N3)-methyltransferase